MSRSCPCSVFAALAAVICIGGLVVDQPELGVDDLTNNPCPGAFSPVPSRPGATRTPGPRAEVSPIAWPILSWFHPRCRFWLGGCHVFFFFFFFSSSFFFHQGLALLHTYLSTLSTQSAFLLLPRLQSGRMGAGCDGKRTWSGGRHVPLPRPRCHQHHHRHHPHQTTRGP